MFKAFFSDNQVRGTINSAEGVPCMIFNYSSCISHNKTRDRALVFFLNFVMGHWESISFVRSLVFKVAVNI